MRPEPGRPGDAARDFAIDGPEVHGVPGPANLLGIESPGLAASLALAERAAHLLAAHRA